MSLSEVSGTRDKRQSCRYVVNTHGKMELHVNGVLMAVNSVIFDNVLIHHIICKSYENKCDNFIILLFYKLDNLLTFYRLLGEDQGQGNIYAQTKHHSITWFPDC